MKTVAGKFGAQEPIILRDNSIGDQTLQKFQKKFDDNNKGALFSNKERKKSDSDADYSGSLNVGGVEHWLSGWLKTSKAGAKFLSLSVRPKEAQAPAAAPPPPFDDKIGF